MSERGERYLSTIDKFALGKAYSRRSELHQDLDRFANQAESAQTPAEVLEVCSRYSAWLERNNLLDSGVNRSK